MYHSNKYRGKNPVEFLGNFVEKKIAVKLKDGTVYKGKLTDIDKYMNVILKSATEYSDDVPIAIYKEIYIRGDTIFFVTLKPPS